MKAASFKPTHVLGIDIAKATFQVALAPVDDPADCAEASFENTAKGHRALIAWIARRCEPSSLHACMEATGPCCDDLALFLNGKCLRLSIDQPRRIKGYAACRMMRSKSDPADARMIAHYCATQKPRAWKRPTDARLRIRAASRRRGNLNDMIQAERNRLAQTSDPFVRRDIKALLASLTRRLLATEKEMAAIIAGDPQLHRELQLLVSIGGIGNTAASALIAEMPDLENLENARQLAAYAGVTPRHRQSGASSSGHTPMSKNGSAKLRKVLFFPAMVAMKHNPICKTFAERLLAKGKPKIVVLGAVMTKLLHLIYGVLRSGQPFNPNHLQTA